MQVLLERTPKLHLFFPHESTLLVSVAGDESIVGDLCPESAYIHPSQHNDDFKKKKVSITIKET